MIFFHETNVANIAFCVSYVRESNGKISESYLALKVKGFDGKHSEYGSFLT